MDTLVGASCSYDRSGSWLCKNDFGAPSSATLIKQITVHARKICEEREPNLLLRGRGCLRRFYTARVIFVASSATQDSTGPKRDIADVPRTVGVARRTCLGPGRGSTPQVWGMETKKKTVLTMPRPSKFSQHQKNSTIGQCKGGKHATQKRKQGEGCQKRSLEVPRTGGVARRTC